MRAIKGIPAAAWAILAVALVLRLWIGEEITDRLPAGADELAYLTMADSVADGNGFPPRPFGGEDDASALVSPGFPYFLGGVTALFGDSGTVLRLVQALLSTAVVALIGLIAWQLFGRRRVALAALAIAAVYPSLVVISGPPMTETLFLPLYLGAVAAALRTLRAPTLGWAAATGALAGLAALTKSVGVIAAAVLVFAIWPKPRLRRTSFAVPALALAVAVAVVAPWTIRNAVEFESFVPVSNELGFGLAGAFNEATREDPEHEWRPPGQMPEFAAVITDPRRTEAEVSDELTRLALEFARDHPGHVARVIVANVRRMLQLPTSAPTVADAQLYGFGNGAAGIASFKLAYWLSALGFLVVLALAVASALRRELRPVPAFIFALAVLAIVPLLLIAAGPRFRLPADVLLIVLAAPAAARLGYGLFCSMKSRRLST